jgi:hypothetical protein
VLAAPPHAPQAPDIPPPPPPQEPAGGGGSPQPDAVPPAAGPPAYAAAVAAAHGGGVVRRAVRLEYATLTAAEALRAILPPGTEAPTAYETIGAREGREREEERSHDFWLQ